VVQGQDYHAQQWRISGWAGFLSDSTEKKKETRRELKTNYFVRKLCGTTSDAENKGVTGFEGKRPLA